jgi:hypothetical protein
MCYVRIFTAYVLNLQYTLSFMVQVKFYHVLHGTSKIIGYCILGGVYQMRVARP